MKYRGLFVCFYWVIRWRNISKMPVLTFTAFMFAFGRIFLVGSWKVLLISLWKSLWPIMFSANQARMLGGGGGGGVPSFGFEKHFWRVIPTPFGSKDFFSPCQRGWWCMIDTTFSGLAWHRSWHACNFTPPPPLEKILRTPLVPMLLLAGRLYVWKSRYVLTVWEIWGAFMLNFWGQNQRFQTWLEQNAVASMLIFE